MSFQMWKKGNESECSIPYALHFLHYSTQFEVEIESMADYQFFKFLISVSAETNLLPGFLL